MTANEQVWLACPDCGCPHFRVKYTPDEVHADYTFTVIILCVNCSHETPLYADYDQMIAISQ